MELWIRSQDRECLMEVDRLDLDMSYNARIMAGGFDTLLGEYKTKERALEILDEIQNILMPKTIIRFDEVVKQDDIKRITKAFEENDPIIFSKSTIEHFDTYVYEMPKE